MARGNQGQQYDSKLFFAKVAGLKKGEEVHFQLSSSAGKDKKPVDEGTVKSLSGLLIKAEHRAWEYNGDPQDDIILTLKDSATGEVYRIQSSMSSITRNIINSLLSAKSFDKDLTIRLYTNKNGYASVFVGLGYDGAGGALALPWALSLDEQRAKITKDAKKTKDAQGNIVVKETNNYLELNEYLLSRFKTEVIEAVKNTKQPATTTAGASNAAKVTLDSQATTTAATDDLPF